MSAHLDHGQDLLREHVDAVLRLARHLVHDPDDAEDVAQESLLAAVDRRPPGVRNVRAWIRGVVRNKALQTHRAESRRAHHTGRLVPPGDGAASSNVAAGLETQRQLVAAVEALPEPYRVVVWFRYFEGVSAREIASRLDENVETVRTRLKRALTRLRVDLDARHGGRRAAWTAALAPLLAPGGAAGAAPSGALVGGLVVAVLLAVVTVVVLTLEGDDGPTDGREVRAVRGPEDGHHEPETPWVGLRGASRDAALARGRARESGSALTSHVSGRVLTQDREPIAGARVWIVEGEGLVPGHAPPWRILGRTTADAAGHYEVELDPEQRPTAAEPLVVLAIAEAAGYWRSRQVVRIERPRNSFDFHLGDGWAMEGYVVDERGRPVVDLPVLVASLDAPPHMVWGALLWTERKRLATESGTYVEQRAVTDDAGRFAVSGLEVGKRYGVLSEDLAWFLQQEGLVRLEAGRTPPPFQLVAVPSRAVRGTVSDAKTGAPLAKALVEFQLRSPDGDTMGSNTSARDGLFLAGWQLDDEQRGQLDVVARASAAGYKDAQATGRLSPTEPILEVALALEPILEERGTVLLSVEDPRGTPLPGRVYVWAVRKDDDRVRLQAHPEREAPGVFRFALPAGAYTATLWPRHVMGRHAEAIFDVRVRPDEVTAVRVVSGAGAVLRLRLPRVDELPVPSGMSIQPVGERTHKVAGASTDLTQQEDEILAGEELVWAGFVPGTWRIELQWGDERLERTVHLAEGDDQLVSFP